MDIKNAAFGSSGSESMSAKTMSISISKYFAYGFLGLCAVALIAVLSIGSNAGLNILTHFANKTEGIHIGKLTGSLYSELYIERIDVDLEDSVSARLRDVEMDITLACLWDMAACLSHLRARSIAVILPQGNEGSPSESSDDYITLPIPIDIKELSVTKFELSVRPLSVSRQVQNKQADSAHPLLSVHKLTVNDISLFQHFSVGKLNVDDVLFYQSAPLDPASSAAQAQPAISLNNIQQMLKRAPDISIPEVFIPVNASLKQGAIKRMCWEVDASAASSSVSPNASQCLTLSGLNLSIEEQLLKTKLQINAQELFNENGLLARRLNADASVNLAQNFAHDIELVLLQNTNDAKERTLKLHLKGQLDNTNITLTQSGASSALPMLSADVAWQYQQTNLPINLALSINNIAPAKAFLLAPFEFDVPSATASVSGDWSNYNVTLNTQLQSEMAEQSGLSDVSLSAGLSPASASINIEKFETSGVLGDVRLSGSSRLGALNSMDKTSSTLPLALVSSLNLTLNDLNLGVFKPDMTSQINGEFVLSHTFTEQWMQGAVQCKNIEGAALGFALAIGCDITLSKQGELNINTLTLKQMDKANKTAAHNILNAKGSLQFVSTDYVNMDAEQVMATQTALSFNADVANVSSFLTQMSGSAQLEGTVNGSIGAPIIDMQAVASALSSPDFGLEQANLKAKIDASENFLSDIDINVSELAVGKQVIDNINIRVQGNQDKHNAAISLASKDISTSQVFSGTLVMNEDTTRWRGKWQEGEIVLPFERFTLNDTVLLVADVGLNNYSASEHCWRSTRENNKICLSDLAYTNDGATAQAEINYDVAYAARHYAPDVILPDTRLPLTSAVSASFAANSGMDISANNTIVGGEIETSQHMLELTAIVANLTLKNNALTSAMFAGTQSTGTLGLQSTIGLEPESRFHEGRLRIDSFDLSLLQRFIPSTKSIEGMVNADIAFNGELNDPQLSGELSVTSGELIVDAYTYPLTDFHHEMRFDGQTADMSGGFSLGKGPGSYQAQVNFAQPFSVAGQINGENMQFALQDSKAQISPSLEFLMSPNDLMVKGNINIPSAEIKVEELPENARTPSSDTIIIGKKQPQPLVPLALDIDLNILIDEAKWGFVGIDALDLKASLSGDLDLKVEQKRRSDGSLQPMRTSLNGQVNVLDGSYEAYGQMLVVQSGKIFFNGEPSLPQFNIRAIRNPLNTEGDVIAGLHVTGNPIVPRVELFSDPPMSQAKQLSYLLQGRDLSLNSSGSSSSSDAALINALVGFGVRRSDSGLGQIGNALGFDSLNIQTAGAGDSSQVQITGRIAEDIQVTYGIGVFDQASEVILKYQIMPQLFIQAKSGLNSAVDIFYQVSRGEID
ncbi:translocation/assembly module TamB domain-containing protein [Glaciecola siphonariae]|uniref:Translocation/assembly module TamB domain-containing protein n=1 Tax=Glaciecola siphonariae TaxID=521012 RepID=A0ABV9LVE8_9ALTE